VRDRATLARLVDDGNIENVFRLQIMNATESVQRYRVQVSGLPGIALESDALQQVAPAEARWVTVSARIPADTAEKAGPGVHPIQFHVERVAAEPQGAGRTVVEKSTFVVPR
jgi:polyferredoxin